MSLDRQTICDLGDEVGVLEQACRVFRQTICDLGDEVRVLEQACHVFRQTDDL